MLEELLKYRKIIFMNPNGNYFIETTNKKQAISDVLVFTQMAKIK